MPVLINSVVLRSWRDAFTELRGSGQPARVGQGREEEAPASPEDSLHQPATAGENKSKEREEQLTAAAEKNYVFHQSAAAAE